MYLNRIKDVYKMNVLNPSRFKKGIVQSLDSVKYDGDNPIGMADSINGNDTEFTDSPCFHGIDGGRNDLEFGDTPAFNLQNIQVELYIKHNIRNGLSEIFALQQKSATARGIALRSLFIGGEFEIKYSDGAGDVVIQTGASIPVADNIFHKVTVKHTTSFDILIIDEVEVFRQAHTNTIGYTTNSLNHICGGINFAMEHDVFDVSVSEIDPITEDVVNAISRWPLPEPIIDIANHTAFDMVGNNHATLVNGSVDNQGSQDLFHWGQNGFTVGDGANGAPIGHIIPASAALDGTDAVGNTLDITQDGTKFLNYVETKMVNADVQELKNADIHNVWYDLSGVPKEVSFAELTSAISLYPDVYGGNVVGGESIKNITLK